MKIMESQELKTYEEPPSIRRRKTLQKNDADTIAIDLMLVVQQSVFGELWNEILPHVREEMALAWLRIVRSEYNAALRVSKADRNGYETRIAARLIEDIQGRGGFGMLWIGALPQERVKLRGAWERALKRNLDPIFARATTTWEGYQDVA